VCSALDKTFGADDCAEVREIFIDEWGGHWAKDLPHGAIVGAVYLADIIPTEDVRRKADSAGADDFLLGNFEPGRFAWLKSQRKAFERPIPYKGRQNIFDVPDDIVAGLVPEGKRA
jgi:hypothetical protein